MLDAIKAVKDGSPIAKAARVHGVPKTSLHNLMNGKVLHGVKPGPKQYLSVPGCLIVNLLLIWGCM